jgi:hypothetical protein
VIDVGQQALSELVCLGALGSVDRTRPTDEERSNTEIIINAIRLIPFMNVNRIRAYDSISLAMSSMPSRPSLVFKPNERMWFSMSEAAEDRMATVG